MRTEIVNPAEWIPKVSNLLAANWAETGFDFPLVPNVDAYQRIFDAGMVFGVVVLEGDTIAGYCSVTVVPHAHNASVIVASNDALFIAPEFRHGLATGRLIKACKDEAKARGADRFTWHCRFGTPFADVLIAHGCVPVDVVVMERL